MMHFLMHFKFITFNLSIKIIQSFYYCQSKHTSRVAVLSPINLYSNQIWFHAFIYKKLC